MTKRIDILAYMLCVLRTVLDAVGVGLLEHVLVDVGVNDVVALLVHVNEVQRLGAGDVEVLRGGL